MHQPIKTITCAIALATALSPLANADIAASKISSSHLAKPIMPSQQSAARCISAIQQHWDRRVKLVLDKRARQRETDTQQMLLVDGWVWEQGQRVRKHHQCTTNKSTKQFALNVQNADQPLLASQ